MDLKEGIREGREPHCPFCKAALERPKKMDINTMESVLGGACGSCGALYIVDPTSKNVGEVMMQALGMAAAPPPGTARDGRTRRRHCG